MPQVSVLMTIYNAAPYLEIALQSVLAQTFESWELIAIENGSTDESLAILDSFDDPRFKVFPLRENIGRTPALRRAFDMAQGEYSAVLDADDVSYPHRLARQVAFLQENPEVVLVGSWARLIDEHGSELGTVSPPAGHDALYQNLGSENPFIHSSSMYRSESASLVGGYPEHLIHAQDCGLWLRLAQQGRLGMIQEVLCDQRVLSGSMTGGIAHRLDVARDWLALLTDARDHLSLGPTAIRRNRDEILIARVKYALALVSEGYKVEGIKVLGFAALANPIGLFRNRVVAERMRW